MIERNIFFANGKAYSIHQTIEWLCEVHHRNPTDFPLPFFDHCINECMEMKFNSMLCHGDQMICPTSGEFLTRDEWFLLWGVGDSTFEYFDGQDSDTVETFPMDDDDFDMEGEESITDHAEVILVEGSLHFPIELDDISEGMEFLDPIDLTDSD